VFEEPPTSHWLMAKVEFSTDCPAIADPTVFVSKLSERVGAALAAIAAARVTAIATTRMEGWIIEVTPVMGCSRSKRHHITFSLILPASKL